MLENDAERHEQVKEALRRYHDLAYLGHCPLAGWHMVRRRLADNNRTDLAAPAGDPGRAVQALLDEAVEALRPTLPESSRAPEWRHYHLLDRTFRQGQAPKEIYGRSGLGLSRSHYYRELDAAVQAVADLLWEREWRVRAGAGRPAHGEAEPTWFRKLPAPTYTRLFGVEAPLEAIGSALDDEAGRWLVVVDGMGGVGKTALAREAVLHACQAGGFADLVWETAQRQVFAWGEIRDRHAPALTVERMLDGIALQIGRPHVARWPAAEKQQALQAALRERAYLIVVDNLETAEDYRAIAEGLWTLANPSKVLITSRRRLAHYDRATSISLHPLDPPAAAAFLRYHAAERGVEALAAAGERDLARVYEAMGGNPLAIKLVVGQAIGRPLDLVLDHLAGARGDTGQLYRFVYQASWDLLSPPARRLLLTMPHLSVRGGPWQAVAAISDLDEEALARAVDELVRLSLLEVSDGPERRYSIHQLTRNFVLSDLVGLGDEG
ncbi:MAG: NB-ARC domain-containing protein [Anaerolineae bacterium]